LKTLDFVTLNVFYVILLNDTPIRAVVVFSLVFEVEVIPARGDPAVLLQGLTKQQKL
jgi:hypothetical protein